MTAHTASFEGLVRDLPIVPVSDALNVAFLKLYGDVELTEHCAERLAGRIRDDVDLLLAGESGGILLANAIARRRGLRYVLARKKKRPNMRDPLVVKLTTIGTTGEQKLLLDDQDAALLRNSRVAIVDEVVSSGATLDALRRLASQAGAEVVQVLAIATEGDNRDDVEALAHLPLFPVDAS